MHHRDTRDTGLSSYRDVCVSIVGLAVSGDYLTLPRIGHLGPIFTTTVGNGYIQDATQTLPDRVGDTEKLNFPSLNKFKSIPISIFTVSLRSSTAQTTGVPLGRPYKATATRQGVGVTKPIFPVPLFSEFFCISC